MILQNHILIRQIHEFRIKNLALHVNLLFEYLHGILSVSVNADHAFVDKNDVGIGATKQRNCDDEVAVISNSEFGQFFSVVFFSEPLIGIQQVEIMFLHADFLRYYVLQFLH